ncbi:glycoside hydrolase family 2 TIM barrel-domain containing protein [uncultured Algibacter sp.]|uniref:glycoside hydrolase family 2 TIM barrel-domain containing protein n=1 Tax=uncultured Algibacter sp. TaxID=298659 RepID=UPI002626B40C|nr:glycoside hydrolase family 2 TIM barrel-domain containing protein [uncultured Algibacter sp.]
MILKRILVFSILAGLLSCGGPNISNEIRVSGRSILVNKQPFIIKGICYHPVPKGFKERSFDTLSEDLDLMLEAGINTIRVYAPIDDKEVLDAIHNAGLKVVIGFGYNQGGHFDILSGSFIDYVNKYKEHPAILMWELGNEFNYHPEWFEGDLNNWYKAMNDGAKRIHDNDLNHPVTTAHGELPDSLALSSSPNIDVWGMNVYRWDNPTNIFVEWKKVSDKPMYLSEAGGDSFMTIAKQGYEAGVNQKAQADANANILHNVFENQDICSGVTMFSFTDGWWKAGNLDRQDPGGWAPNSSGVPYDGAPNEEYWGMVDIERNKKETFDVIKAKYKQLKN